MATCPKCNTGSIVIPKNSNKAACDMCGWVSTVTVSTPPAKKTTTTGPLTETPPAPALQLKPSSEMLYRLPGLSLRLITLLTFAVSLVAYASLGIPFELVLLGSVIFTVIYGLAMKFMILGMVLLAAYIGVQLYLGIQSLQTVGAILGQAQSSEVMIPLSTFDIFKFLLGGLLLILLAYGLCVPYFVGFGVYLWTDFVVAGLAAGVVTLVLMWKFVPPGMWTQLVLSTISGSLAHIITTYTLLKIALDHYREQMMDAFNTVMTLAFTQGFEKSMHRTDPNFVSGIQDGVSSAQAQLAGFFKMIYPQPILYVWLIFAGALLSCHLYRQKELAKAVKKAS